MLFGYALASTEDQDTATQVVALKEKFRIPAFVSWETETTRALVGPEIEIVASNLSPPVRLKALTVNSRPSPEGAFAK